MRIWYVLGLNFGPEKKWRTRPISWADLMQTFYFSPSFIVKHVQNLQPPKGGCKFWAFFSFLVFLFFCLFLPYFSFSPLLLYISKAKIAHQLRCAAKWRFSPPKFPASTSQPLAPPPPPTAPTRPGTPPPGIFNKKSFPPPSQRLGLPFPLPRAEKI